jgi:hypothetical protein
MKLYALLISLFFTLQPSAVMAADFDLSKYQEADGAIVTWHGSGVVDPYFAMKALLMAKDAGLSIRKPAMAWVEWMLKMQRPDGLFERYKLDENKQWKSYAQADADDALLAIWIQLLHSLAPREGLPAAWQESAKKAEEQLEKLHNKESGIYHISEALPVGLLMDNIEIYTAFESIAKDLKRLGQHSRAKEYAQKADKLHQGILTVFNPTDSTQCLITTQTRTEKEFYPDKVAYIFSLPYVLEDKKILVEKYKQWIRSHRKEWFSKLNDNYPWGLLAVISLAVGDSDTASCWRNMMLHQGERKFWNVMEEAALQHIEWKLNKMGNSAGTACIDGVAL